jgi:hypothetical protein
VEIFCQSASPSRQMKVSPEISPRERRARMSDADSGPTCSPSTTMCQVFSELAAGAAVVRPEPSSTGSGPEAEPPSATGIDAAVERTTMMWLHFLQRILKAFPRTLSSEIEYLAWHASQTIFIESSFGAGRKSSFRGGVRL